MSRYVIDLRNRAARDLRLSGGKAAGLHWLGRQRFNVPPGFVITSAAFNDFVVTLQPRAIPGGGPGVARREELAALVLSAPLPVSIRREIVSAYARLGGRVAVRSSATVEDGTVASHAGQFETLLDIDGEEALLRAVRACWASRFSTRAGEYAKEHGSPGNLTMAVVVQRMVEAAAAGVAFSVDPVTAQPCVVIEAARGLGVGVVGGTAQTDRYVVDERGAISQVVPAVAGRPVLSEAEILGLAHVVAEIERRAGRAQDVEWAWDGTRFSILQARPVTALHDRHVYSSRLVSDMAPGLVKPLVYDVNTLRKVDEVFGALFTALTGCSRIDTSQLVARLFSRVYADTTVLGEMLVSAGLPANLFEVMLRDEKSRSMHMRPTPRVLGVAARMTVLVFRKGRLSGQQSRQLREGYRNLESYRVRDWSSIPLADLLAELDVLIRLRDGLFWFFFCSMFNSAARSKLLRAWVERKAPGVAFGDLIRGLAGLKSLEPSLELMQLAAMAQSLDDESQAALFDGDDASLRRLLSGSAQGRILLEGVHAFLARHGYLSSNGSDFSSPSWNENPVLIWRSIARGVTSGVAVQQTPAAVMRDAACLQVRRSTGPLDRWIFERLMAGAITAIDLREHVSVLVSQYTYEMRRLFLAAAGQLVNRGGLVGVEDVFYLTYQEMYDLAAGHLDPAEAAACIRQRRAEMENDAAIDPPEIIVAVPGKATAYGEAPELVHDMEYLTGIGGSPGLVSGIARVVHDPVDAPPVLGRTDILVVPFSDVGWTPLFAGIGGIVAETGGQLSHAAIVAREYNLPAVVNVRDATRRICDGQALTVDGSQGRVYLRPESA